MFAEPCEMRVCWQSLGDASLLAELGRCEFVGRAWEGASMFAEPYMSAGC